MNRAIYPFVALIFLAIVGIVGFEISNYVGVKPQTAPGTITRIDFQPEYESGSGKSRTTEQAYWRINVTFGQGQGGYLTNYFNPPPWQAPGVKVMVTYLVGRYDHSIAITDITKADW